MCSTNKMEGEISELIKAWNRWPLKFLPALIFYNSMPGRKRKEEEGVMKRQRLELNDL